MEPGATGHQLYAANRGRRGCSLGGSAVLPVAENRPCTQPFKLWSSVSISRHGRAATVWSLPVSRTRVPSRRTPARGRLRARLESNRDALAVGVDDARGRRLRRRVGSGVGGSTRSGQRGRAPAAGRGRRGRCALAAVTRGVTAGVGCSVGGGVLVAATDAHRWQRCGPRSETPARPPRRSGRAAAGCSRLARSSVAGGRLWIRTADRTSRIRSRTRVLPAAARDSVTIGIVGAAADIGGRVGCTPNGLATTSDTDADT